jgi:hypothetical protein
VDVLVSRGVNKISFSKEGLHPKVKLDLAYAEKVRVSLVYELELMSYCATFFVNFPKLITKY